MIIKSLADLILVVVQVLTVPIKIPSMPEGVQTAFADFCSYIEAGLGIVANYTHLGYLATLFGLVVAIETGLLLYKLIMFIIRKIPMLGVS